MNMKKSLILLAVVLFTAIGTFSSCDGSVRTSLLPNVSGKEGDVLVVINKSEWDGNLGQTIRDTLTQEYPYIPMVEPMFNLSYVPHSAFNDMFQMHRNIVIVNIDPKATEGGILYKKDVWAAPQSVIKLNASSSSEAADIFKENSRGIITFLEQTERERMMSNTRKYEEHSLVPKISKMAGGSPHFPYGYFMKKKTNDFIWVSHETQYTQQNVLIYKYPVVEGMDMMAPENLRAAADKMLMENIPGMFENTYMIISPVVDPYIGYRKYKDNHFAEMKGFWEVYGDYMGGPFVSHVYYAPDGKNMVMLVGFVYAPKYDKRTYMRQLEAILFSFEWNKD